MGERRYQTARFRPRPSELMGGNQLPTVSPIWAAALPADQPPIWAAALPADQPPIWAAALPADQPPIWAAALPADQPPAP